MKLKIKDYTRNNNLLSNLILTSLTNTKTVDAIDYITNTDEWKNAENKGEVEVEICLTANGIELDIREFCNKLEKYLDEIGNKKAEPLALELFEKFKQQYISKNSNNAILSKLKQQTDKCFNELKQINNNLMALSNEKS